MKSFDSKVQILIKNKTSKYLSIYKVEIVIKIQIFIFQLSLKYVPCSVIFGLNKFPITLNPDGWS